MLSFRTHARTPLALLSLLSTKVQRTNYLVPQNRPPPPPEVGNKIDKFETTTTKCTLSALETPWRAPYSGGFDNGNKALSSLF